MLHTTTGLVTHEARAPEGRAARARMRVVQRALAVVLLLLVASCSGGGCSSGCSACGTTPLPGGFPTAQTVTNAASVRITRPGLDFVQANLGLLAEKALGSTGATGGVATFPIPKSTQSLATLCTPATPGPTQCKAEIDLAKAKLRVDAITPNRVKIDGLLPVRIRDLPVSFLGLSAYVVAGEKASVPGQNLCAANLRGVETFPYKDVPLNIELPLVPESRAPRTGYTKVDVANAVIDIALTKDDVEICDSTCGGGGGICQDFFDTIKDLAFNILIDGVKGQVKTALGGAFCTAPTPAVTPPCPTGSTPDSADPTKAKTCVFAGTQECVPSLLGADGRMDLSAALAAFSPGTQGGLDFVLAAAGSMNPAPGSSAALPNWTPRKPPVPAEDNNANGVSLGMLGGTLPQPESRCVTPVPLTLPQGIPVPAELTANAITPWPAGVAGPHVGVALAGRFLDHALAAAYNSGVLCLGVSTEQVEQLSVGYLSILSPSLKILTFQQGPAAAAIATRPGLPPKAKIGGGTSVDADPLLTITLEKLAIDFYVWSLDRFVRVFTYTADVMVPINLQTGKDAKNPNGGLLPVLGKLRLANASIANDALLLDDPVALSGGLTGLLGGIVDQFLGGGISPIDLQSALASFGLGLEIPAGGIRKLTSGTDDFIGVFANITNAAATAREEADTRARIVERVVDPGAMGLATAERSRFPRLRVEVEGLASRPTEHTWWIDQGTHAAWTQEREIVVDRDAMLLQGRHVLHVASRVVGDTLSEDSTPVEIPFVIDTLAPWVEADRGDGRVTFRARDLVTGDDALVARTRVGEGAPWSEWTPLRRDRGLPSRELAAAEGVPVDVEVRDEEGNVGSVSLPLVRGKVDGSLAGAGSACGCRTVGTAGSPGPAGALPPGALVLGVAALALVVARRRIRRT